MRIAKTTGLPDRRGTAKITHGDSQSGNRHPLYKIWAGIKRRCYNRHERNFERYGGRGIVLCERWQDYANFKADMVSGYAPGLSIERKENDGNYEPGNCTWATRKEQCRNRRSSCLITYRGKTRTAVEWSEIIGMPYYRLHQRIQKLGWSVERAMTAPPQGWSPGVKKSECLK